MALRYALLIAALGACDDAPVSYSATVTIELKAKSGDTAGGVIDEDKSITTESGNPYGAFIGDARQQLGGNDPGSINIRRLDLSLGAGSTNVTQLGEVFDGAIDVEFEIADTNNTYPAGTGKVSASTGAGPTALAPKLQRPAFTDFDYIKLVGGNFKVVLTGPAAGGFVTKGADANLELAFQFEAFE